MAKECYIFDGLTSREKSVDAAFSLAADMVHRNISSIPAGLAIGSLSHSRPCNTRTAGDQQQKEELLNEFFVLTGRYPIDYWEYSRPELWQRVQGEKWLLEEEKEKQRELLAPSNADVNTPLLQLGLPDLLPLAPQAAASPAPNLISDEGGPRRLVWQTSDKETLVKAYSKHGTNWRMAADDPSLPFAPLLMRLSGKERANKLKVSTNLPAHAPRFASTNCFS